MLAWYMLSLCVCLSVTSWSSTETAKPRITQTVLYNSPGTSFLVPKSLQNSNGITANRGTKYRWGRLKWRFSTDISLYLRNGAKYGHTYYGRLIGPRMCFIDWCYFQWPWETLTTPNDPIFWHFLSRFIFSLRVEIETSNLVGKLNVSKC